MRNQFGWNIDFKNLDKNHIFVVSLSTILCLVLKINLVPSLSR